MRSLRLSFFVYCNYYYYYFCCIQLFVQSVSTFDFLKWKTNENLGDGSTEADEKVRKLHNLTAEELNLYATAQWNYHTKRNDETTREALKSSIRLFLYQKLLVSSVKNMSLAFGVNYEDLLPMVYFVRDHGTCKMNLSDFKTIITLKSKLKTTIGGLTVCEYRKTGRPCDMPVDEINFVMANSADAAELKHYWKAWHNHTGYEVKNTYVKYIGMLDHKAKLLNNVSNAMEYYMKPYLNENCNLNVDQMYETVRPLYLQLYARVRKVLRDKFGTVAVPPKGPVPVHLLGSILGQPWTNLLPSIVQGHYNENDADRRTNSKTARVLFDQANGFFASIGMGFMPKNLWSQSVFDENDRFADCTPSSWDMYKNNDFRIKMCLRDTADDVYTMHKQLGLVHYFSAYKKQPIAFQYIPDAVFAEGLLNALTLSVKYREFVDRYNDSASSRHAYLLQVALEKVAVLPYAYAADVWLTDVTKGCFAPKRMNDHWWSKRLKYEGVVSPISKGKDKCANNNYRPFDPSASYNTLTELPPIRYFLTPIVEFQIFKALCTICDEYDGKNCSRHLYECNLRGYRHIGRIIKSVMSKGSSVKWPYLFQAIVGHRRLEVEPLLEYFKPLYSHLCATNSKTNEYIGWKN